MKKYIFRVGVGDLPPKDAIRYIERFQEHIRLQQFFPEGRVLYLAEWGTHRSEVETIEVEW